MKAKEETSTTRHAAETEKEAEEGWRRSQDEMRRCGVQGEMKKEMSENGSCMSWTVLTRAARVYRVQLQKIYRSIEMRRQT